MGEDDVPPVSTACGAVSCPCVPTLRPSVEEWSDPLGYLASVRGRGELVGMVKVIVPGEGDNAWEPKRYARVRGCFRHSCRACSIHVRYVGRVFGWHRR